MCQRFIASAQLARIEDRVLCLVVEGGPRAFFRRRVLALLATLRRHDPPAYRRLRSRLVIVGGAVAARGLDAAVGLVARLERLRGRECAR